MADKKDPIPAHKDGLGQKPTASSQWSAFAGRNDNSLDKVAKLGSVVQNTGLNVANYAAAARARSVSGGAGRGGDDALSEFRRTGAWDAKEILSGFVRQAKDSAKKPVRRRDADPSALLTAARTLIGIALWGKDKGIRDLANAARRSDKLDDQQRRKIEGIGRAAGNRTLTIAQLEELVPLLCAASGSNQDNIMARMGLLIAGRENVRTVGDDENHNVKPRQFLDIRKFEGYLLIADFPEGRAAQGRREPKFERVLGLLRDVKGELYLIDVKGLHEPSKGVDDGDIFLARMRKPDEMALREFMGGLRKDAPNSPLARVTWNGYLSASIPTSFAGISIPVIKGAAFRYM